MIIRNLSDDVKMLNYPSAKKFEFVVYNKNKTHVLWESSAGQFFLEAVKKEALLPGEEIKIERLNGSAARVVSQKKEGGEILTGFESRNKYVILESSGQELFLAAEVGGNVLARLFLKSLRPFQMTVMTTEGTKALDLQRPFKFYFHQLNIMDAKGALLGTIERQVSWLRRIYLVKDSNGQEIFKLLGPILHPWTFNIIQNGIEVGKITKKWSGLLKEGFTDADNFGITFPNGIKQNEKAILLGAVFLIDFVHFEN